MKTSRILAIGISMVLASVTISCKSDAKSDGQKAAELYIELRETAEKYGYDSPQTLKASKKADQFTIECREKYDGNDKAQQEFMDSFNEAIKADMMNQP